MGREMLLNLRHEQSLNQFESPKLTILNDGKIYNFNFTGIKETGHHNMFQYGHLEGMYNIPELIKNAMYITTEKNEDNKKPELKQFHYYALGTKLNEDDFTAKIVFTENMNGEVYYDQSLSSIEKGKLIDIIQQKNKLEAFNPINRRDSNELYQSGNPPDEYYDKRLISICQCSQIPYMEQTEEGKWASYNRNN